MLKKRILIFSTAYEPFIGGAEIAVKEITDRLGSMFDFEMITARIDSRLPATEQVGKVLVHRVGKGTALDKFRLFFLGPKKATELGKFDATWAIMASYAGFAALRYKKQHPTIPYLLTLQEGDSRWHIYKHVWWCWGYFKQIFQRADRIQAISSYLKEWAIKLGSKSLISVVPNAITYEIFRSNPEIRQKASLNLRSEIGIPAGAKILFTSSRLVPKNGVGDLIKSLPFLPASVHLVIFGGGELDAQLRQLAESSAVSERVHFLGTRSNAELPPYLWGSDVFCRPSLSEGLGISFLEAMASGIPMIATPVGGIPEFLTEGVTGWFCKVHNPKSIAKKVLFILDEKNKATVERVVANAEKLIIEKYTWDTVAQQMKQIFETL